VAPERLQIAGRGNDVDIVDAEALIVECRLQRVERELSRMLFAVEPFFLQDDRRHAVVEQREARVMSPGYDPENLHDDACGIDWVLRFSGIVLNPKRPGPLTDLSWDCLRRHAKVGGGEKLQGKGAL